MKLQKENKFKKILFPLIAGLVSTSIIFTMLGGVSDLEKKVDQNEGRKIQTELIEECINNEYNDYSNNTETSNSIENANNTKTNNNSNLEENNDYIPKYNFDKLHEINPKIIGVLEGDIFEGGYYPVVSSDDFDEVDNNLVHNIDGSYNTIGTITADPNNIDNMEGNVSRIWGHHFAGEEESGTMFSSIVNYDDQEFYENHKNIKYYTENGEYELNVFASIKDDPRNQIIGQTDNLFNNMNEIKKESMISTNINIGENDRVMILTTCTRDGSRNDPFNRVSLYTKVNPIYEKKINNSKKL